MLVYHPFWKNKFSIEYNLNQTWNGPLASAVSAQTVTLWQIQAVALWRDIVTQNIMSAVASCQFFKMLGSVAARNSMLKSDFHKIVRYHLRFMRSFLSQSGSAFKIGIWMWNRHRKFLLLYQVIREGSPPRAGATLVLIQIWQPWNERHNFLDSIKRLLVLNWSRITKQSSKGESSSWDNGKIQRKFRATARGGAPWKSPPLIRAARWFRPSQSIMGVKSV